jgi:hypothetical protein
LSITGPPALRRVQPVEIDSYYIVKRPGRFAGVDEHFT